MRGVVIDREERRERLERPIEAAELGRERERASGVGDEERLDPEAVAAEDHAPPAAIVDREGPHADEVSLDVVGVLLVEAEEHLRIAVRLEADARAFELPAELRRVVDLAVVDEDDHPVVARHWLATVLDVDDREPTHRDRRGRVGAQPRAVRAAVEDALGHPSDD